MNSREEFIKIYTENVTRPGTKELFDWICKTDFFKAPASTRYHLSVEGGLCEHSVHVYKRLRELYQYELNEGKILSPEQEETVAIVGLLHDICKADFYTVEMRNRKEDGRWIQVPVYTVDDKMPLGHGEKSAMIILQYMRLRLDEVMAIRWHMGAWNDGEKNGAGQAYGKCKLAVLVHMADMMATYLDENE